MAAMGLPGSFTSTFSEREAEEAEREASEAEYASRVQQAWERYGGRRY